MTPRLLVPNPLGAARTRLVTRKSGSVSLGAYPLTYAKLSATRPSTDPHDVDAADISIGPGVSPEHEDPIARRDHLLDIETDVLGVSHDLTPGLEYCFAADDAPPVRGMGVLEHAVAGDEVRQGSEVVPVERLVEPATVSAGSSILRSSSLPASCCHLGSQCRRPRRG
jgi:hypothetical protein